MNKKSAIIQTTLRLITENGFHGAPMSQIAKEANVAAGTIYHHFKSKDDLIVCAYDFVSEELGNSLVKNDDKSKNYKERFYNFWINLYDFFIQHPVYFKFLVQYANSPFITNEKREEVFQYYEPVILFFVEAMENEIIITTEINLIISILYGTICEIAHIHITGELEMTSDRLKQAIEISWNGLRIYKK